jgi:hypothetical protein
MRILGISHDMTTAHHAQADGQSERENQTVIRVLTTMVNTRLDDWDTWLPVAEFLINDTVHEATGMTRFKMDLGYEPHNPLANILDRSSELRNADAEVLRDGLVAIDCLVRDLLADAQSRQKDQYDKHRRTLTFKKGDRVFLSTKDLSGYESKISARWMGPLEILEVDSERENYRLDLPSKRIRDGTYPWFHISKLKPYIPPDDATEPPARASEVSNDDSEYEVEAIVDHRTRRGKREFRVRWRHYAPHDDTWERIDQLSNAKEALDEYWKSRAPSEQLSLETLLVFRGSESLIHGETRASTFLTRQ